MTAVYFVRSMPPGTATTKFSKLLTGQLGVSRVTLSRVINGRSAITAEMALRVGKWVGNGPEIWLRMQGQYDLFQAKKKGGLKVRKAKRPTVVSATPA